MKKLIILLLTIFSSIPSALFARDILTPRAEADYARRIGLQPEIADRLVIPENLTPEEEDALRFLYAYIATSDVLDYPQEYFLENIRLALQASKEMPWGHMVPDREWRHFVLPVRVNNENLDDARRVFYEELKPRVRNLPMKDAILEVNHWCHEKVSYQPSDARTSSPLATVKNALGRCGEESTFTVAALRSVGIPARQVYTPRWAHTDDNHAWVEAWADGKWYFLGACEPEAVLDLAWFNAPAARGMLMTTKVIGAYDGPEEQLEVNPVSTVINVTENYAPVACSSVFVTDMNGNPVKDAKVRFSLYNYSEFYPLAVKTTDAGGRARFTSGRGDMVIWASDGHRFNLAPMTAGDTLRLVLDKDPSFTGSMDIDLTPPAPGGKLPEVSAEAAALNESRKVREDSVRMAYVNTFLTEQYARELCADLDIDQSNATLLVNSRGNHNVIEKFLRDTPAAERHRAVKLLGAISEKDLHDITPDVLSDQMEFTRGDEASSLFVSYVLNPRIEREILRPFKQRIQEMLTEEQSDSFIENPQRIVDYINGNVSTDSIFNPENYRQSSVGTLKEKTASPLNKALAFVAVCRALGIPAQIDPVSGVVEYADRKSRWQEVSFDSGASDSAGGSGKSVFNIKDAGDMQGRQPKYYSQFTVSRIVDGFPQLMEFNDFETVESINSRCEALPCGQYVIITGQRLANGSVLSRAEFFQALPDSVTDVSLVIRQDTTALQVIGTLDAEMLYTPLSFDSGKAMTSTPCSILSTAGRGYYVLGVIEAGHEPSAHAINDIAAASEELAATGRTLLLLFRDQESLSRYNSGEYGKLPPNVKFGLDDGSIVKAVCEGLELPGMSSNDFPLFVVADSFNRIIFVRKGYSINLGETLARILDAVE